MNLKAMRCAQYLTQRELAAMMGVHQVSVSAWETGDKYPRPSSLPKLAKILNTTEGEIIAAVTEARMRREGSA